MMIQIDTREHKWERARIEMQLSRLGVKTIASKLYVGDYQSWDNPRLVLDRKKNLLELGGNVTQQHERLQRELIRARDSFEYSTRFGKEQDIAESDVRFHDAIARAAKNRRLDQVMSGLADTIYRYRY